MEVLRRSVRIWIRENKLRINGKLNFKRYMSSSEVATALRPFYFYVHPDLFGQFPLERAVNESSLQSLSSFIEATKSEKLSKATTLTFYLKSESFKKGQLKSVKIALKDTCVRKTVASILHSCNLPTTYVDNLAKKYPGESTRKSQTRQYAYERKDSTNSDFKDPTDIDRRIKIEQEDELLSSWLERNLKEVREKMADCALIREEVNRLKTSISKALGLNQIILDCGWDIRHYRGCLASFQALIQNHPTEMQGLQGRTLVFGSHTGVSFDGYVLLNSGEVRHNWLDFIKNVAKEDQIVLQLPAFEKAVSRVLRDIKVVRRKFQPKTIATQYKNNLRRLTTSLSDYQGRFSYPKEWPSSLQDYEIVVESQAGPLMVSPTGQFIVPSSCPSALLVNFLTDNLEEARRLNLHYQSHKHIEKDLQRTCIETFNLGDLRKDDSITPDFMIQCCSKLLHHKNDLSGYLDRSYLFVTSYYSIMSDGQICIPWNWNI